MGRGSQLELPTALRRKRARDPLLLRLSQTGPEVLERELEKRLGKLGPEPEDVDAYDSWRRRQETREGLLRSLDNACTILDDFHVGDAFEVVDDLLERDMRGREPEEQSDFWAERAAGRGPRRRAELAVLVREVFTYGHRPQLAPIRKSVTDGFREIESAAQIVAGDPEALKQLRGIAIRYELRHGVMPPGSHFYDLFERQ